MYPPQDRLPEDQPKPSEAAAAVRFGFMWLAMGALSLRGSGRAAGVIFIELAACSWIDAWAAKTGLRRRALIRISAFAVFLIADCAFGLWRL
jgi:hypothetical protein